MNLKTILLLAGAAVLPSCAYQPSTDAEKMAYRCANIPDTDAISYMQSQHGKAMAAGLSTTHSNQSRVNCYWQFENTEEEAIKTVMDRCFKDHDNCFLVMRGDDPEQWFLATYNQMHYKSQVQAARIASMGQSLQRLGNQLNQQNQTQYYRQPVNTTCRQMGVAIHCSSM